MNVPINILIIEDHDIVVWALERMLTKAIEGAVIKSAPNFDRGLQILLQSPVDLVILDIGVPGGNTVETIQYLRNMQAEVKVLIHTGLPEKEFAAAYLIAGANGFVSKHAAFEDVLEACQTVLNNEKYISNSTRETIEGNTK